MNFLVLLVPFVIGLTWLRLIRPGFNKKPQGSPMLVVPLPLLARIRMHLAPSILAFGLSVWLAIDDAIPWWALVFPAISTVLLVAIPISYSLTDEGIRLGWTSFRRWTEFAGVRRAAGGARLVGVQKRLGMQIWLSGSRGDDEFIHFLRQTVKNAYKGKSSAIPFPVERATPSRPVDGEPLQTGMAAYSVEP